MKTRAPTCNRARNTAEKVDTSQLWKDYHRILNYHFSFQKFQVITKGITYTCDNHLLLAYFPRKLSETQELAGVFRQASTYLLNQQHSNSDSRCVYNSRRFSGGATKPLHMGFYEQNLPNDSRRIWNLYESTSKPLLLLLRPIITYLSTLVCHLTPRPPVDPGYGLFGSIFTSLVVNSDHGEWHIDPKDKLAVIIYFGQFQQGELLVASPLGVKLPVQATDVVFLHSSKIYHKATAFKGQRISISLYSKKTTKHTTKGELYIKDAAKWAVSPNKS